MAGYSKDLINQLKEACKISRARWAVWLKYDEKGWELLTGYGLNLARQSYLAHLLHQESVTAWLAGALSGGRTRSRQTRERAVSLGCLKLFAFPNVKAHCILLVGTDGFGKLEEGIWRIQANYFPVGEGELIIADSQQKRSLKSSSDRLEGIFPGLFEIDPEASYNLEKALGNVLVFLTGSLHCESALLSIRSGDSFQVSAVWNLPESLIGVELHLSESHILTEMVADRRGVVRSTGRAWPALEAIEDKHFQTWLAVPILIGQRVIGYAVFFSTQPRAFTSANLRQISHQMSQLAYVVENAIVFAEAAHYLQQLALLNDLASAASLGLTTHEVAERVAQRLRRTFQTERVGVYLLSVDGQTLREYSTGLTSSFDKLIPTDGSLVGTVVKTALPARLGDLRSELDLSLYQDLDQNLTSVLVVPLKYRGKVIGALALGSPESHTFSIGDEQLLILIAGHLAGLFENLRLSDEARERAHNLSLINRQLQAVRETALDISGDLDLEALLKRVVHRARELVGARGAELGLIDEQAQVVRVSVSEIPWCNFKGPQIPMMAGVTGRVAAFGEPLVVADYSTWSGRLYPEKKAPFKSVAGVPLKFKGQVMGTLVVTDDRDDFVFHQEHLQLLELLAPQVTIWIRNARLYQELQERIEAQHQAENRLVRSARLAAVGEMAAGIAHELNNPLTTVSGFVELLLEEMPPESPQRSELELVLREAQRARGVVRRLLDFSRPSEEHRLKTDMNELVEDVLGLVHHLMRTGGVTLVTELAQDLPWPSVNPGQIKQVILNILHNAIQSMTNGGVLTVRTTRALRENRDWVVVTVRDTGEGILQENLERIFEPFFSTRPPGKGTGLGLSVSYGIITEHEGFIDVESQVDQGSCFSIYFPSESEEMHV